MSHVLANACPARSSWKKQGFFSVDNAVAFCSVHASKMLLNAALFGAMSVPCWLQNGQLLNLVSMHTPVPMSSNIGFHVQLPKPQLFRVQVPSDL